MKDAARHARRELTNRHGLGFTWKPKEKGLGYMEWKENT